MLRNNDLNYGEMMPENYNEDEIIVHFLIDTSASMTPYIDLVCRQLNRVVEELKNDSMASKMVETAITTFNDTPYLYQDYRPVTQVNSVNFTAGGGTELNKALIETVNLVKQRGHRLVDDEGISIRTPFIFLITDGYGGDVTEAARLIKERTDDKKLQLWTLGVGEYDKATVAALHPDGKRWYEMKDTADVRTAYEEFFQKVVTASVKAVSHSRPGERTEFDNPIKHDNSTLKAGVDGWLEN